MIKILTYSLLYPYAIAVKFTEGRTPRVTETTVGVLIPVLRTGNVRASPVCPENRPDGFLSSVRSETLINMTNVSSPQRKPRSLDFSLPVAMGGV